MQSCTVDIHTYMYMSELSCTYIGTCTYMYTCMYMPVEILLMVDYMYELLLFFLCIDCKEYGDQSSCCGSLEGNKIWTQR